LTSLSACFVFIYILEHLNGNPKSTNNALVLAAVLVSSFTENETHQMFLGIFVEEICAKERQIKETRGKAGEERKGIQTRRIFPS
jgi:hypothetical protein